VRSPSLFWRTLLLVLLLIVASLAAWLQSYRVFERAPRAQSIAQQVVSVVNITRFALLYSDPFDRRDLLRELATNEGIRIYPLEPSDSTVPLPEGPLLKLAEQAIVDKLGEGTQLASSVNGIRAWVSLAIEDDNTGLHRARSGRTHVRHAVDRLGRGCAAAVGDRGGRHRAPDQQAARQVFACSGRARRRAHTRTIA
jgi:two-component system osmolarity sensor histidine kinase EnvZ